jgi:GNAT superfamily N-acetyltransferase
MADRVRRVAGGCLILFAIRPSRPDDGPALRAIERLAGARFREVGLGEIADNEPMSADELSEYSLAGRAWVAVDATSDPIGYVIADIVDGNAHIEQISVHPDHQGTGVGRALVEQIQRWAVDIGAPSITLTTFIDVPWNRPLYEHLGFVVMTEDEIGPELAAVVDSETAHGLDPSTRVCMRGQVGP